MCLYSAVMDYRPPYSGGERKAQESQGFVGRSLGCATCHMTEGVAELCLAAVTVAHVACDIMLPTAKRVTELCGAAPLRLLKGVRVQVFVHEALYVVTTSELIVVGAGLATLIWPENKSVCDSSVFKHEAKSFFFNS